VGEFRSPVGKQQLKAQADRMESASMDLRKERMITAIALLHDATLATRNSKDFLPCGVRVANPFGRE
jgi:predicted nucleic acid-binding protein